MCGRQESQDCDPGATRTRDQQLRRLLLYPLSYGAICANYRSSTTVLFHRRRRPALRMRVKACTRCGETKPLDQFPPLRRGKPRLQSWCRSCFAEVNAKNYVPYYARERERILSRIAAHRDDIRRHIIEYLRQHPCVDCGETDIVVLEFDHQGDKVADVSTFAMGGRSWETVKAEIDKCEVRCANCHRLRTAQGWTTPQAQPETIASTPAVPTQMLLETTMSFRRCRVCGSVKSLTEFPFRSIARQTRQWVCLACQRAYSRHWYGRNRKRQIANARKHKAPRRAKSGAMVLRFLDAEIDKCQVRCANCHRRKTAERGRWYRTVMA